MFGTEDKRVKEGQFILDRIKQTFAERKSSTAEREGPKKPIGKNRPIKTNKPSLTEAEQKSIEDKEKEAVQRILHNLI